MNLKRILITGASRGLGSLIAVSLIQEGHEVIGLARTPREEWEIVDSERFKAYECDITDESQVKRLFSNFRKSNEIVDVLINNAASFSADLLQISNSGKFSSILNTNLVSAMIVTREASNMMRTRNAGRVISISSIAAGIHIRGNGLYGISKHALEDLMRHFAVDFQNSGITYNSIRVSFVEQTKMFEALTEEARLNYEARLLSSGPVDIDGIMHPIRFFMSDYAKSITGQVLDLGSSV